MFGADALFTAARSERLLFEFELFCVNMVQRVRSFGVLPRMLVLELT